MGKKVKSGKEVDKRGKKRAQKSAAHGMLLVQCLQPSKMGKPNPTHKWPTNLF